MENTNHSSFMRNVTSVPLLAVFTRGQNIDAISTLMPLQAIRLLQLLRRCIVLLLLLSHI